MSHPKPGVYAAPEEKVPEHIKPEDLTDYYIWSGMAMVPTFYGGEVFFYCGDRHPVGKLVRRYTQYASFHGGGDPGRLYYVVHSVGNYPGRKILQTWSEGYQQLTRDEIEEVLEQKNPRIHPDMQEMLRHYLDTGEARSKYPVL